MNVEKKMKDIPLVGYADKFSLEPDEKINFKVSSKSADVFSRIKQKKVGKNKFLCGLLSPHSQPSRYYLEARGKRSTIVTARGTRKAEKYIFK